MPPRLQNAFGSSSPSDSDDDDDPASSYLAHGAKKASLAKPLDDANLYDYDGAHDSIREKREAEDAKKAAEDMASRGTSKYIGTLLEASSRRKVRDDVAYTRKLVREAEAEKDVYGDRPTFVSESYKKRLKEQEE
eukprot:CAMPEP_0182461850 /NCGR_PEP_ID=MMETSP1319-20130603/6307_1 /TAXON_ID=172717 /ORGANISM="Bolidomonas pacifica, Strain RCC208" /LENGTH=134 /DNA_ID=CAMNT_0024661201 /DNA_START=117 /DNA_END=518 /DNA_ORIENTATION=+